MKICEYCKKNYVSKTDRRKARKFCSFECYRLSKIGIGRTCSLSGKHNPNWKGGRRESLGYILVNCPNHPFANDGYVAEHRLVMEKKLKRYLKKSEVVHHLNGKKRDNRIENLSLFKNQALHQKFHCKITVVR